MGNYHICHLYFWSYCIHQDINLYHHCVALCSEELSGRITGSCYFCGEWASQGTLENHNTKSEGSGRPCSHLNNLAATLSRTGGNNQQRTLTWLSSVTSSPSRPRLTPTCPQQRRSSATRGPAPPDCMHLGPGSPSLPGLARLPPSGLPPLASPPPPRLYNVYWATLRLTLQSAIAKRVSIIATHWRNRMNQTQEVK